MTKRYDLTLTISNGDTKELPVHIQVSSKTMETIQQLVRLAMGDFEKVEKLSRHTPRARSVQIVPPLQPTGPTPEDIEEV